jgi:DNA-binding GntR family transcriptional regulator
MAESTRGAPDAVGTPDGPSQLDATEAQYLLLRQHIIEGQIPPGSTLLETALSAQYGVSRTPVREALGRLAQDGFIERSARGFRVRARSPEEILEIYEARIALESTSAALAATRRTEFDLARLAHMLNTRREETDSAKFGSLNNDWHDALRAAGHNATITGLLDRLDLLLSIYRPRGGLGGPPSQPVDDHSAILDAIRDRRPDAAQEAMRAHLSRIRDLRVEVLLRETN